MGGPPDFGVHVLWPQHTTGTRAMRVHLLHLILIATRLSRPRPGVAVVTVVTCTIW